MRKVPTLIVDDSVVYRTQIKDAVSAYRWIEVVGTASNGRLALERIKQFNVELLILDLEMPEMDGLQTLRELHRSRARVKTIVFSSLSKSSAEATLEALKLGAADFVTKPGPAAASTDAAKTPAEKIRALLAGKLEALFPERFSAGHAPESAPPPSERSTVDWDSLRAGVLVIGSSTGGPVALERLVLHLRHPLGVPILVAAEHMPPIFTASLAERLGRLSGRNSCEASHGQLAQSDWIYVAPGGYHMTLRGTRADARIHLDQGPQINSVRPAVDPLFKTAADVFGPSCVGVVLTGMGHDGRDGAQAIKATGGAVLIQDRSSSVVYGMPGAVEACGAWDMFGTPEQIASTLNRLTPLSDPASPGGRKVA